MALDKGDKLFGTISGLILLVFVIFGETELFNRNMQRMKYEIKLETYESLYKEKLQKYGDKNRDGKISGGEKQDFDRNIPKYNANGEEMYVEDLIGWLKNYKPD